MEKLWQFLRDQPVLVGVVGLLLILIVVSALVAGAMHRAGVSLKPLVFFAVFFGIVTGPQITIHLLNACLPHKVGLPGQTANSPQPVSWDLVFGRNADPALVIDAKISLDAIFHEASEAQLAAQPDGASTLAARFESAEAADAAQVLFRDFFQMTDAQGDVFSGWIGRRYQGQGEWVHLLVAGSELYAWIGPAREGVLARRFAALGSHPEVLKLEKTRGVAIDYVERHPRFLTSFILVNILCAVLWFFRGSSWAARIDPEPGTVAMSSAVLRSHLLATNPATRIISNTDGSLEATWRYDEPHWLEQMRTQQVRTAHRLVLHFDEASQVVRVRESWTALETTTGFDRPVLIWKAATGITFFQSGKQILKSENYSFDIQGLKTPLISVVTANGWRWQPLVWNTPACLRWLLE